MNKTQRIIALGLLAFALAGTASIAAPTQANANVITKIKDALSKIGDLKRKLAEFATGEIKRVIDAFKKGPKGLMEYALNKIPGPIGKVLSALILGGGNIGERLKRAGQALISELKKFVDSAKNGIKNTVDKLVKPLFNKAKEFITNTVLKPAMEGLGALIRNGLDSVIEKVASAVLGKSEAFREKLDGIVGALDAVAAGDTSAVNAKLAAYNVSVETMGKDVVNLALDYGLGWVRGKVVAFVMKKVNKLMQKVWTWAYRGVSAARNAVQGAVGSVPFAGGVLAAFVGFLIDQGWEFLKGKVNEFIEAQVNKLADLAAGKARELLSGPAAKAGGAIQWLVDKIRGPLQEIAQKVKAKIAPVLSQYKGLVAKLEKLRDKRSGGGAAAAEGGDGEEAAVQAADGEDNKGEAAGEGASEGGEAPAEGAQQTEEAQPAAAEGGGR